MGRRSFLALLVAARRAAFFCCLSPAARTRSRRCDRAREKIQLEETRVFDFLHGLGTALSDASRPADLHVLIVEGALRILKATAARSISPIARASSCGRPLSRGVARPSSRCRESQRASSTGFSWQSYLRLRTVHAGRGRARRRLARRRAAAAARRRSRLAAAARVGPRRPLARCSARWSTAGRSSACSPSRAAPGERAISPASFQIFKAIAEQSAFALYTAIIFSEAAEKKRLDQDLQVAHEIQRILLPASAPELDGYQISGINIPAQQVSGDYYDYIADRRRSLRRRHRRCLRQGRAGLADHGHVPQRPAQPGAPAQLSAGDGACGRSTRSFSPTSRRTCSSAWPTRSSISDTGDAHPLPRRARRAAALQGARPDRLARSTRRAWRSALTAGACSIESPAIFP